MQPDTARWTINFGFTYGGAAFTGGRPCDKRQHQEDAMYMVGRGEWAPTPTPTHSCACPALLASLPTVWRLRHSPPPPPLPPAGRPSCARSERRHVCYGGDRQLVAGPGALSHGGPAQHQLACRWACGRVGMRQPIPVLRLGCLEDALSCAAPSRRLSTPSPFLPLHSLLEFLRQRGLPHWRRSHIRHQLQVRCACTKQRTRRSSFA